MFLHFPHCVPTHYETVMGKDMHESHRFLKLRGWRRMRDVLQCFSVERVEFQFSHTSSSDSDGFSDHVSGKANAELLQFHPENNQRMLQNGRRSSKGGK